MESSVEIVGFAVPDSIADIVPLDKPARRANSAAEIPRNVRRCEILAPIAAEIALAEGLGDLVLSVESSITDSL